MIMSIAIILAVVLQALTLIYLYRMNSVPEETADTPSTEEIVSEYSKPLLLELNEVKNDAADADRYFNAQIAHITTVVNELSEHVDGILEIVTSIAVESADNKKATTDLTDRVSRLAYTGSQTKELLNRTIDNIDWDDDAPVQNLPTVYDTAAQPQVPYVPPVVPNSPRLPVEPLPEAPAAPVAPVEPAQTGEIEPPIAEVPLVAVRGDNDPLITDLRAEPFRDDPNAYDDPHALPMSAEYEVMGSGRGHGRRSSRTNGLRNRF